MDTRVADHHWISRGVEAEDQDRPSRAQAQAAVRTPGRTLRRHYRGCIHSVSERSWRLTRCQLLAPLGHSQIATPWQQLREERTSFARCELIAF
jgi:hypothetical protein